MIEAGLPKPNILNLLLDGLDNIAKHVNKGLWGFFTASSRILKQLRVVFGVWIAFSCFIVFSTFLILLNPDNNFLGSYLALAIMLLLPIVYALCGYIGYRTRPTEVTPEVTPKVVPAINT